MPNIKIIFIGCKDIYKIGGIENYMYNLTAYLSNKNIKCVVYCESDRNEVEYIGSTKIVHLKSIHNVYFCKILLSLYSTLHSLITEPDALLYHYNAWPPALSSWIPKLFNKKSILQGHGLEWKRTKYNSFQRKLLKYGEWLTALMNNNLIMVSQEQTDYFLSAYNKKCTTIPSAIKLPIEDTTNDLQILSSHNLSSGYYFLYMGRLVKDKNPDVLIKSFNSIFGQLDNVKLVIAGNNNNDASFVNKLYLLAKGNSHVIFTGAIYGETKECILRNCMAYCIPSTLEGLPISLLEAMSHKKICIASDIPSCHEALGDNGIWVTPEDEKTLSEKLLDVYHNFNIYANIGVKNYERVRTHYTWEIVSSKYMNYIQNAIDN